MKFPDSEIQLPPAFIGGGGRGCPIPIDDCLRLVADKLRNFSAVSETPRTDLPVFIEVGLSFPGWRYFGLVVLIGFVLNSILIYHIQLPLHT